MLHIPAPRLMIAGASSGSGKTTAVCGLLQLFLRQGLSAASFKCGPDYIDPMFHSQIIGAKSRNLDLFFLGEDKTRTLLAKNARGMDISLLEGVMGFYDGLGNTTQASSYALARATETPVVLVLNCKGQSLSAAAVLSGFVGLRKDSGIACALLNHVSPGLYPELKTILEKETGIPVAGYLPSMKDCALESRHLGLITAGEVRDLRQRLEIIANRMEETIELPFLLKLAREAPPLPLPEREFPLATVREPVIAVAKDKAFCFYYQDALELLEALGARLVPFSPLEDNTLPQGTQGLLLGGGYPELYASILSKNQSLLGEIRERLEGGMPCVAECGGFLYLHRTLAEPGGISYPMVGFLPGAAFPAGKLQRFGYVEMTAREDSLLFRKGEQFPAHEFHYWESSCCGEDFRAQKPGRPLGWDCVHTSQSLYAGFPHFHFCACPQGAKRFVEACARFSPAPL